jgi:hypothetical protein
MACPRPSALALARAARLIGTYIISLKKAQRSYCWHTSTSMSDTENNEPATNANGKRVDALKLGSRKKVYVLHILLLLLHSH